MEKYYTTTEFCRGMISAIIGYMTENEVEVFPMDFLAKRDNYGTCEAARTFYKHGWRYFKVIDGKLHLYVKYEWRDDLVDYIVDCVHHPYPDNKHYCILTEDLIMLVRIAYDTIGSIYFKGRGVESYDTTEIDELEKEYEERRNEVG